MSHKQPSIVNDVAKAICGAEERNGGCPWDGLGKYSREVFEEQAEAAIKEIQSQYVIVDASTGLSIGEIK